MKHDGFYCLYMYNNPEEILTYNIVITFYVSHTCVTYSIYTKARFPQTCFNRPSAKLNLPVVIAFGNTNIGHMLPMFEHGCVHIANSAAREIHISIFPQKYFCPYDIYICTL